MGKIKDMVELRYGGKRPGETEEEFERRMGEIDRIRSRLRNDPLTRDEEKSLVQQLREYTKQFALH